MAAILRKLKTLLVGFLIIHLVVNIYKTSLGVLQNKTRSELLEKVLRNPLCTSHVDVIKRLRRLTKDLIYIRMAVDRDVAMAIQIERHYDNLQKLLREIEFLTSGAEVDPGHRFRVEEDQNISNAVCPEEYKGATYGYPFYRKGFETTQCLLKTPMTNLVTLILDGFDVTSGGEIQEYFINNKTHTDRLWELFEDVRMLHPKTAVHVIWRSIRAVDRSKIEEYSKYFTFHILANKSIQGDGTLRHIVQRLNTPYVLIAPGLSRLTEDANLERLIRVLSTHSNTHFAGGSVRKPNGHWSNGCLQTQLKNYTLSFRQGYFHSMSECLVCDQLNGPFLVKTSVIKELVLSSNLDEAPYWDLFLHAKKHYGRHGHAVVTCPDVMFHVGQARNETQLASFARKHEINKIVEADGTVKWFGCGQKINLEYCALKSGIAVPPCCLEYLADAIKFLMDQCERHRILCELQEGTLLGAVKLNKVLPWERDSDITFLTADYQKLKDIEDVFTQQGYRFHEVGKYKTSTSFTFKCVKLLINH